ncbi:hypothetical protein GJ496_011628 [Pomphorhynchus laevis]|nr:hypothetical protein GJ496_011628 [Pomphorhynchus laevis]
MLASDRDDATIIKESTNADNINDELNTNRAGDVQSSENALHRKSHYLRPEPPENHNTYRRLPNYTRKLNRCKSRMLNEHERNQLIHRHLKFDQRELNEVCSRFWNNCVTSESAVSQPDGKDKCGTQQRELPQNQSITATNNTSSDNPESVDQTEKLNTALRQIGLLKRIMEMQTSFIARCLLEYNNIQLKECHLLKSVEKKDRQIHRLRQRLRKAKSYKSDKKLIEALQALVAISDKMNSSSQVNNDQVAIKSFDKDDVAEPHQAPSRTNEHLTEDFLTNNRANETICVTRSDRSVYADDRISDFKSELVNSCNDPSVATITNEMNLSNNVMAQSVCSDMNKICSEDDNQCVNELVNNKYHHERTKCLYDVDQVNQKMVDKQSILNRCKRKFRQTEDCGDINSLPSTSQQPSGSMPTKHLTSVQSNTPEQFSSKDSLKVNDKRNRDSVNSQSMLQSTRNGRTSSRKFIKTTSLTKTLNRLHSVKNELNDVTALDSQSTLAGTSQVEVPANSEAGTNRQQEVPVRSATNCRDNLKVNHPIQVPMWKISVLKASSERPSDRDITTDDQFARWHKQPEKFEHKIRVCDAAKRAVKRRNGMLKSTSSRSREQSHKSSEIGKIYSNVTGVKVVLNLEREEDITENG